MKNIILYGSSRSGKSTLAKLICKELNYSYVSIDKLVTAFEQAFPDLQINHKDRTGKSVENLEPFLFAYLRSLSHFSKTQDNICYVIEGSYINIEKLLTQHFFKRYKLLVLLHDDIDKQELFKNIRKHDCDIDWTYELTDEELDVYCQNILNNSNNIKEICKKNNITYYDTSKNREEIFKKILKEISEQDK